MVVLATMLSGCGPRAARPSGAAEPAAIETRAQTSPADAGPAPRFVDVTERAGIRFRQENGKTPRKYLVETMGSGCAFLDYDGDGRLDILLLNGMALPGHTAAGRPTVRLYHNEGGGHFRDVTHEAGLDRQQMYAMGVAVGDYDNDGRDDLYVSCVLGPGHLFHNETRAGKPAFRDVTREAGVGDAGAWGSSCAWLDYDRDGKLDLFVCNYVAYASLADDQPCFSGSAYSYCIPTAFHTSHCVLYHNEGGGRFRDVTGPSGVGAARGKSLGVAVWDYDDDGWPDIFVANDTEPGFLFHNQRNGTFREIGLEAGIALSDEGATHSGMGIVAGDPLNDGRTAVAITNYYGQQTSLYRLTSPAPLLFHDDHQASGIGAATAQSLGFGLVYLDYDNDGQPDILQVNGHVQDDVDTREPTVHYREPSLLLRNLGGGRFTEVAQKAGAPFTKPIVGRGCAWGDYDDDGRVDALITENGGPAMLWHNETATPNHWLTLKLVGVKSNRDAIGAVVRVTAGGVTQRAAVQSGSSYLSASDLRPHFGLGAQTAADVEVRWPTGAVDRLPGVRADQILTVREGSAPAPAGKP